MSKELNYEELNEISGGSTTKWNQITFYQSSEYQWLVSSSTSVYVYQAIGNGDATCFGKGTCANYRTITGNPTIDVNVKGTVYTIGSGSVYHIGQPK